MLTERQLLIFRAIIDHFTWTVQPVGSKNLIKEKNLPYSSATIRNEMGVLEEHGLIEKTHSSSGRVPSEKGYRFYVDYLSQPQTLTSQDRQIIGSLFSNDYVEMEQLIQNSASMLSNLTHYTSILLGPATTTNRLSGFRFVPINQHQAMLILITDQGHVDNHLVSIPEGISLSDLEKMVNIFNERLVGVPVERLRSQIPVEVTKLLEKHVANHEKLLGILDNPLQQFMQNKVYFGGKTNMLHQPEFHDIDKVRDFLGLLEEEQNIYELFRDIPDSLQVKIGREIDNRVMDDCSIITATYKVGGESVGGIVLLGPTHMEYSRMMGLVDVFSRDLTNVLTKLYLENRN